MTLIPIHCYLAAALHPGLNSTPATEKQTDPPTLSTKNVPPSQAPHLRHHSPPSIERPFSHNVFAELGGPGLIYSLGYEAVYRRSLAARAGVSVLGYAPVGTRIVSNIVNTSAHYLWGRGPHHIELGAGLSFAMFFIMKTRAWSIFPNASLGYRYSPEKSRWLFRAAFQPYYGGRAIKFFKRKFQPWGTLAVGWKW